MDVDPIAVDPSLFDWQHPNKKSRAPGGQAQRPGWFPSRRSDKAIDPEITSSPKTLMSGATRTDDRFREPIERDGTYCSGAAVTS
jgi:hypothetical protein